MIVFMMMLAMLSHKNYRAREFAQAYLLKTASHNTMIYLEAWPGRDAESRARAKQVIRRYWTALPWQVCPQIDMLGYNGLTAVVPPAFMRYRDVASPNSNALYADYRAATALYVQDLYDARIPKSQVQAVLLEMWRRELIWWEHHNKNRPGLTRLVPLVPVTTEEP